MTAYRVQTAPHRVMAASAATVPNAVRHLAAAHPGDTITITPACTFEVISPVDPTLHGGSRIAVRSEPAFRAGGITRDVQAAPPSDHTAPAVPERPDL